MIDFYLATTDEDYAKARMLFNEYAKAININLDFQHFDEELDGLKKMYALPYGGIILARRETEIIGCVAIRKINLEVGELKRMYIKPNQQKKGIGKILLAEALLLAKNCNYTILKLDTLNYMLPAIHLYKQAGFYEIAPYYHNPIATAVYFEKTL
jgi:ribosomal protein S18 acetylase RimI-like enzyme